MEANVIARVLLICFYCEYHVNSKAIQNDILMDNICGPNINTNERVTCIYQRPGMYRTHLLLPTINRLTFERFDDSVLVVNRNIPNLKMLFISTTTPASHLNGCDFVHIETAATIKVIIDGQTFTCGGNEFTTETVGESSLRSISITQDSTSKIPKTRRMSTINGIIPTSQSTNEGKTSKIQKTWSMTTINGITPTSHMTRKIQKTRSMTTINGITPTSRMTSKIQKTESMTTINGIISTSHSTNDIYKLAVIGTGAATFLSIVVAVVLGLCLKYRLIELKKITVGGVGIRFRDSRRHILDETALTNISMTPRSSTQPKSSIELELQSPSSSTQPESAEPELQLSSSSTQPKSIEPELQSSTVEEEIQTSTPVSSRTRSKKL